MENFKRAKVETRHWPPRLCGDLDHLRTHLVAIKKQVNQNTCEVCGKKTLFKCTICDTWLCVMEGRKWNGATCTLSYHSDSFFALARSDYQDIYGNPKTK